MKPNHSYYRPAFLVSLVCFTLFCIIATGVQLNANWISWFDQFITHPIVTNDTPVKTTVFTFITNLGGIPVLFILVLFVSFILIWQTKNKRIVSWFILQSAIGAGGLNLLVKLIFQRERPTIRHLIIQGGYSFPSGHSMGSFICYGGMVFLFFYLSKKNKWTFTFFSLASLLVLLIGFSRIYVGVHFPSDVIGGYLLGAAWLALMIGFFPKWIKSN